MATEYAVIDVETTGFSKQDRVVEMAVVIVDAQSMRVSEQWHTIINPKRDVGPTRIHRITDAMVRSAPTFSDVAAHVGSLLQGRVLVAHNLSFDERFMYQEFDRLPLGFDAGVGVCTYRLSGMKLEQACAFHCVELDGHHRALSDALAAAQLLAALKPRASLIPVRFSAVGTLVPGCKVKTR